MFTDEQLNEMERSANAASASIREQLQRIIRAARGEGSQFTAPLDYLALTPTAEASCK